MAINGLGNDPGQSRALASGRTAQVVRLRCGRPILPPLFSVYQKTSNACLQQLKLFCMYRKCPRILQTSEVSVCQK